ncbi:MAG TPA: hypothetical protein DCE41_13375 [Cytophagales bacterium]|nr:hypothetical protein [Cytophagales bacterium]HAA22442.1 hypothetical protein [Cytophagales bacterium]HAP59756.1 hypothetical protein [Cytophagales bacterium]
MRTLLLFTILLGSVAFSTQAQTPASLITYDFMDEEQRERFQSLGLDDNHPNLLNPEISVGDIEKVRQSWGNLHQQIGKYLKENQFGWGVEGTDISIVHKFYFSPEGNLNHYFFRVMNKEVTLEKRQEYAELVKEFSKEHGLDLTKDQPFAQCGKTRYANP